MAKIPLNYTYYLHEVYRSYFDQNDASSIQFDSIDEYVEDLRIRLRESVHTAHLFHDYYHTNQSNVEYRLDKIIVHYDYDLPQICVVRDKTEEELVQEEVARVKAAARKKAAAEKKRKQEIALLEKLKKKYEDKIEEIET